MQWHSQWHTLQAICQCHPAAGAEERLAPILMTALTTGLALIPLLVTGNKPGQEIEYPMAFDDEAVAAEGLFDPRFMKSGGVAAVEFETAMIAGDMAMLAVMQHPGRTVFLAASLPTRLPHVPFRDAILSDHRGLKRTLVPMNKAAAMPEKAKDGRSG